MRNMSFIMTKPQMRNKTKTVTRRQGWWSLTPGIRLQSIEKGQGLKKGETVVKMGIIETVDVRPEPINAITQEDCEREGFGHLTPAEFVDMYCRANKCQPDDICNRIEFKHIDEEDDLPLCVYIGCHNEPVNVCEMCDSPLCEAHTKYDVNKIPLCQEDYDGLLAEALDDEEA